MGTCKECQGEGWKPEVSVRLEGKEITASSMCTACRGTGFEICPTCNGTHWVDTLETVDSFTPIPFGNPDEYLDDVYFSRRPCPECSQGLCERCRGTGAIDDHSSWLEGPWMTIACPECVEQGKCPICHGDLEEEEVKCLYCGWKDATE
jgi:hypothetical protein